MQEGCQLVLLQKVTERFSSAALQQTGLLMTVISSDVHCLPHRSLWSTNLSAIFFERLSDVICVAYVTHLQIVISERQRKRSKRVPGRMRSDIRGVSPTSGGVCHPNHLPLLLLFAGLLQSVKNWCQHLSKAKCLFYTECQSSHNLLINQPGKKQIVCICVWVCLWALVHLHLSRCMIQPSF